MQNFVTKDKLADYVSKNDFHEFKMEMRDFRDETNNKFDGIEIRLSAHNKRFNEIERKIDDLKSEYYIHIGVMREAFRHDLLLAVEHLQGLVTKTIDPSKKLEFN